VDKWEKTVEESDNNGEKPVGIVEKPGRSKFTRIPVDKLPESVENPVKIGDKCP